MKKLPVVLNVVLLIAVAVLYVLHFTTPKSGSQAKILAGDSAASSVGSGDIVYINIDSVMVKYDMYKDLLGDLEEKINTSQAQLESKQRTFQKNVNDYQDKAQKGLITRSEAAQIEQNLQQEEQSILLLQNQLQNELAEEEQVSMRKVLNSIIEYLDETKDETGYKYVLGTSFGGAILYGNGQLNISDQVISGLNEKYSSAKD